MKSTQLQTAKQVSATTIPGFLKRAKKSASGSTFTGRFSCQGVQWTGAPPDAFVTFSVTAEELTAAAENNLLWTDQDVQRGVIPGVVPIPPRELSVAAGYPDPTKYVFDSQKADEIVEKLLSGSRLFLSPLVWNLRPGTFEAFDDETSQRLFLYSGKVYLPDSHHRHQAIAKAVQTWRSDPAAYPNFSGSREFKVELYFLSRTDEGNYFYDKNQLPKPTAKSKAYDLTSQDDLSLLAKSMVSKSRSLTNNVNRVTDRLSAKNPQVVTLSTLREMMRSFAGDELADEAELEGLATVAAEFYDMLAGIRPELGPLAVAERVRVRRELLVDSAVMMHGYAALMVEFNAALGEEGRKKAAAVWSKRLSRLGAGRTYRMGNWSGDLFEKRNPLWQRLGVLKPSKDGRALTVLNTGAARAVSGRALTSLVSLDHDPVTLDFLTKA